MVPGSLWLLMVLYALTRVTQAFPDRIPVLIIVALHVLIPLVFAIIHGSQVYRFRDIAVFAALCFAIGNGLENLSIATGFPFGHYHFTDVMGPKLMNVPILLGLAYVGIGYLSWIVGCVILGTTTAESLRGLRVFTVPLFAAFVMIAWDLAMDAVWCNLGRAWVWHDGGPWFGVPLSNFRGWYVTIWAIYQCFALYLRAQSLQSRASRSLLRPAISMYAVCALGNLFVAVPRGISTIVDGAGTVWRAADILGASLLVSVFLMAPFALAAWLRTEE